MTPMTILAESPVLRSRCGTVVPLDVDRWRDRVDRIEAAVLEPLVGPILDVGCGPGRVVAWLVESGRMALGIDTAPSVVADGRARGVPVIERSVFDPLPGEGRWGASVLLDGNIGIGGDPDALMVRMAELVAPGGQVLVEFDPPGTPGGRLEVRLEAGGRSSGWFGWARVDVTDSADLLARTGWTDARTICGGERWFVTAIRS